MKLSVIISCFGIFIFISQNLIAQNEYQSWHQKRTCQTFNFSKKAKSETQSRSNCSFSTCDDSLLLYSYFPVEQIPIKEIRIRWVVFSDDDGSNTLSNDNILRSMEELNNIFESYRFHFEIHEIINEIDEIVNHANLDLWRDSIEIYETYGDFQNEMMNIFVINDFEGERQAIGNFPFDVLDLVKTNPAKNGTVIITNDNFSTIPTDREKYLLAHEIGHVFGLFHTFQFSLPCDDLCKEYVDANSEGRGLNPYRSGDFIGDTHPSPSPFVLAFEDPDNLYDCSILVDTIIIDDFCEIDTFENMESVQNNIMNYFDCRETFTLEQTLRMHCIAESYYPNYYNSISNTQNLYSNKSHLILFPNPTTSCFNLMSSEGIIDSEIVSLELISTSGEILESWDFHHNNQYCLKNSSFRGICYLKTMFKDSSHKMQNTLNRVIFIE